MLIVSVDLYGSKSNVFFTKINFTEPEPITSCTIVSNSSDSLDIKWEPTKEPNGNITYYKVTLVMKEKSKPPYQKEDYCDRKFKSSNLINFISNEKLF